MSLYLKYRPREFDEMLGNEDVISSLKGMVKDRKSCPQSFLFHGQTGCGKTTIARILAKELKVAPEDLREVDSADFRGIDTIREIRRNSYYLPQAGEARMWILDEVHKLTNEAQNALLKILEDTPKNVYFVLCTTEPHKLIPTIRGRCQQFQMSPLQDRQMMILLHRIAKWENETLEREIYNQIVQDSLGLPRNAIQTLEQVLKSDPEMRLKVAQQTANQQSRSIELCRALINQSSWEHIRGILKGLKDQQPESIRRQVLGYSQSVLLNGANDQAAHVIEEFSEPLYDIGLPGLVYACYAVCKF